MSTAKLILDEASRLLTLLWRVSLPTNGQCTLHCEQVGDTWIQRLKDATGACVSVSSIPQRMCLSLGNVSEGRGAIVFVTSDVPGTEFVKSDMLGTVLSAPGVSLPDPPALLQSRPVALPQLCPHF